MPLAHAFTNRYADELMMLAAATHRPASIVNIGCGYAIRIDFEYQHYLLAVNAEGVLADHPDAAALWRVALFKESDSAEAPDQLIVTAESSWLVDAFDLAFAEVTATGQWPSADLAFGSFNPAVT
ncbi:hypothetical protein ACH47B_09885 [Rhodococcus sp. NPDC019627]|uniref:hypothetical protein n=1 Tax=Rhodococcus TaxID=1827 RepID=UPI001F20FDA8|nr:MULTISPECIES: hypothetical protein [Rhodococcus]MDV7354850.1 hypothetical protein [Rhodococcus oxybenzonivorans]